MFSWCKGYGSKGDVYTNAYTVSIEMQSLMFMFYDASIHALLNILWITFKQNNYFFLWSWCSSWDTTTTWPHAKLGVKPGKQLNKLPLCCQVLGGRKRHSGLKKELKPLLQRPRNPRGWGGSQQEERRWVEAYRERKQRVKNKWDKEAEGDGKSERQSREGKKKKTREQKRLDMISMECLLTVLRGPGPWDKWLNTAPVKARGFLWACVSLCALLLEGR